MACSKKDYIRAAEIVQCYLSNVATKHEQNAAPYMKDAFVEFFRGDNPRFDEQRFRAACEG
jgi:hypothetical protein